MVYYVKGATRWQRYRRESYRPTTGWKTIIEELTIHPVRGTKFLAPQLWAREEYVGC